jgi:valyl-tRNA synthetase
VDQLEDRPGTSTIVLTGGQAQVELAGLIDVDAEVARIDKELDKARGDLRGVEGKLGNSAFVDKAPAEVVQQQRDRQAALTATIDELTVRRGSLAEIAS